MTAGGRRITFLPSRRALPVETGRLVLVFILRCVGSETVALLETVCLVNEATEDGTEGPGKEIGVVPEWVLRVLEEQGSETVVELEEALEEEEEKQEEEEEDEEEDEDATELAAA